MLHIYRYSYSHNLSCMWLLDATIVQNVATSSPCMILSVTIILCSRVYIMSFNNFPQLPIVSWLAKMVPIVFGTKCIGISCSKPHYKLYEWDQWLLIIVTLNWFPTSAWWTLFMAGKDYQAKITAALDNEFSTLKHYNHALRFSPDELWLML